MCQRLKKQLNLSEAAGKLKEIGGKDQSVTNASLLEPKSFKSSEKSVAMLRGLIILVFLLLC